MKNDNRVKATINKVQAQQLRDMYPQAETLGDAIRTHLDKTLTDEPSEDTGQLNEESRNKK